MTFNPDVRIVDVSYYQDDDNTVQQIDFAKMRAAGASGVIVRAGQRSWPDPDYSYNFIEARKAGLPTGAYFLYDSRETPEKQAQLFLSLIGGLTLELGIWLDLEENYNGNYKGWQNWKKCLAILKASGRDVGIYTGPYYWVQHRPTGTADLAYFKNFPLWIAHYGVSQPLIPGPWDYAVLWQMGTPVVGHQYGVESLEIDMSYWNGSLESFCAYWGITPQTETEKPMARYEAVSTYSMSRRPEPGVSNTPLQPGIAAQSKIHGDNLAGARGSGECWLQITDINGAPSTGYVAIEHGGVTYCTLTEINPPAPTDGFVASFDGTITLTDAAGVKHSAHVAFDVLMVTE
jgi:lysozyme